MAQAYQPQSKISGVFTAAGVFFFVGMMSVGYYYNLTFVQLGLIDLGERILRLSRQRVAMDMAFLAVLTSLTAVGVGWWANKRRWGTNLILRLRMAFFVVLSQTILTFAAFQIESEGGFILWLVICSITLGVGVPVTFSMTVDLVPRNWRGSAAALITSVAYLAANLVPSSWQVKDLALPLFWIMPAGLAALGAVAFLQIPFISTFAHRHQNPDYALGRYVNPTPNRQWVSRKLIGFILLMFVVFFVDSLGFLRMLETPLFMLSAWQSPVMGVRLTIGVVHVIGALAAGVLYDVLDVKSLFYWIFGIFSLVHLLYTFSLRFSGSSLPLSMPVLYALAVSIYTVVNFALWADVSTPATSGLNTALGVAFSGWFATFISTALAVFWEARELPLDRHLNIVDAIAMLTLVVLIVLAFIPSGEVQDESR
jgi:MFS family permease